MMNIRKGVAYVEGNENGIDFDARYSDGRGAAISIIGWPIRWESFTYLDDDGNEIDSDDGEWVPEVGTEVMVCMVGDDYVWRSDIYDLSIIEADDYCPGCGQIGCKAYAA